MGDNDIIWRVHALVRSQTFAAYPYDYAKDCGIPQGGGLRSLPAIDSAARQSSLRWLPNQWSPLLRGVWDPDLYSTSGLCIVLRGSDISMLDHKFVHHERGTSAALVGRLSRQPMRR